MQRPAMAARLRGTHGRYAPSAGMPRLTPDKPGRDTGGVTPQALPAKLHKSQAATLAETKPDPV
jgi:hypothetical protein